MPTVSIVMAAWNSSEFIEQSIQSVLAQSFDDWELIVSDDGSTDTTPKIVASIASRDHRVRLIRGTNSGKPGAVRNRGLAVAKGQYVSFLDSDDLFTVDRLESCMEVLERHPTIDFLFHDMYVQDGFDTRTRTRYLQGLDFPALCETYVDEKRHNIVHMNSRFPVFMLLRFAAAHTNTVMIRRELRVFGGVMFWEGIRVAEDTDLWLRVAKESTVAYLPKALAIRHKHPGGISSNRELYAADTYKVLLRNRDNLKSLMTFHDKLEFRQKLAQASVHGAYVYIQNRRRIDAIVAYARSFFLVPSIQALTGLLKSFLPFSWRKKSDSQAAKDA